MTEETTSKVTFSVAGLFTCVGLVWAVLLLQGSLDGDWILAGFLSAGLGFPAVSLIDRVSRRFLPGLADDVGEEDEAAPKQTARAKVAAVAERPVPSDAEALAAPRRRVLLISSGLEALAVAFLAGHYTGSVVIGLAAGVVALALAVGLSVMLARNLTPA